MQNQREKTAFKGGGSGDFDSTLSVSHEIQAPSIDDVLRAAKLAISAATKTIKEQSGGVCGCF